MASSLGPASVGCIYPDHCIKVTSPGHDWCRNLANAIQWPAGGSLDDAEPVLDAEGDTPKGCVCFNDAEDQILDDEVPACRYDQLLEDIEQAAREECQSLVLPGYDHNCWTATGPQASTPEEKFFAGPGSCIGSCEYGGPPPGGSCPDPNPYECATSDGGHDCEPEGGDEGTGTGAEQSKGAVLEPDAFIACTGWDCEIDEAFARDLYADPSPLVAEGTLLVYDRASRRHVFQGVTPGSVVHALGLRSGDRLESVDGIVIDGLDAALQVYMHSYGASSIEVRVQRGSQWVDLTYTFVP